MTTHSGEEAGFALPVGTVTFLLTDIEGSSRLWEAAPEAMTQAVARHYGILDDAVAAAHDAQVALGAEPWPEGAAIRVRMALHTGEATLRDEGNYFGDPINRCGRLRALAHGGQTLLSQSVLELAQDKLPDGAYVQPTASAPRPPGHWSGRAGPWSGSASTSGPATSGVGAASWRCGPATPSGRSRPTRRGATSPRRGRAAGETTAARARALEALTMAAESSARPTIVDALEELAGIAGDCEDWAAPSTTPPAAPASAGARPPAGTRSPQRRRRWRRWWRSRGLTNKAVAERLFVSPRTVQAHLRSVFGKLGVTTRAELAAAATRRTAAPD